MPEKLITITEVIFQNTENGYTVAQGESEEELLTVVGLLPPSPGGREFLLTGEMKQHPTYGEQFAIATYEERMPTTVTGIEGFLSSGLLKGVGKKTAKLIVNAFGEDTFNILEKEPHRLLEVEGIGEKRLETIREAFTAHREFAQVTLFFQQFSIEQSYAMKLYKVYGGETIAAVQENPYRLVDEVFGIGFRRADRIAVKMGVSPDDEKRIKAALRYVLWFYVNEGHVFVPQNELCEKTAELLEINRENVYEQLVALAFDGLVRIDILEERPVVYLMPYFQAEQNVSLNLSALVNADLKAISGDGEALIRQAESDRGESLTDNQKFAIMASLTNGVSVITGGPGTGKTTIINTLIYILQKSGLTTAIAAPTGRAAKRITETGGLPASTIHRLLEYYYSEDEDEMRFGKNSENPLDYDAVIIDEASMIDLMLMNGLLRAILPGTRLILVGDGDQLPPVGAGNVLRDILDSEMIYSVKLTEIFRQGRESLIVTNAHKINRGEYPDCNEKEKDFFLMQRKTEKEMLETIKDLCYRRLPGYYTHRNPIRDIQVLTPVRKGLLGSINLNLALQGIWNPPSPEKTEKKIGERTFREQDKVMQIRNNYQLEWKRIEDFKEGQGVFNGDVGFIHNIDLDSQQLTVIFDENKYATYDFAGLDELELAYAVTVHKSQGSEFPIVVMPISWFPQMLATRNLLYTAVTRGREAVVLVGSENRMNAMVDNNQITKRYSGLSLRLKDFLSEDSTRGRFDL